jgi:hypothetical protein
MSIDLAWGCQKIPGFEKHMKAVQETTTSEEEYKTKYAHLLERQRHENHDTHHN